MSRAATPEQREDLLRLGLALRRLGSSMVNENDHTWVVSMGPKTDAPSEPVMVWSVNGNVFELDGEEFTNESIMRVAQSGEKL